MTIVPFFFGTGFGHVLARRPQRGRLWLAALFVALLLTAVSFWLFALALLVPVAAAVDAYLCGRRAEEPFELWHTDVAIHLGLVLGTILVVRTFAVEGFRIPSSSMYPTVQIGDHIFVDKLTPRFHAIERGEVVLHAHPCEPDRIHIKRVIALAGDTVEVRCGVVYVDGKAVPSQLDPGSCSYDDHDESTGQWFTKACSRYRETLDGHTYDTFSDVERPVRTGADPRDFPTRDKPFPPSCHGEDSYAAPNALPQQPGQIVETKDAASATACEPQLHYVVPEGFFFALGDNRYNSNDSRYSGPIPMSAIKGRALGVWLSDQGDHGGVRWDRIGPIR